MLALRKGSDMDSIRMNTIITILFTSFLLLGLMGCRTKESGSKQTMTIKEILSKYNNEPIGKSIGPIARRLAGISILAPIDESSSQMGGKLSIAVANDNQGNMWAHIYTDEEEFLKYFKKGSVFS